MLVCLMTMFINMTPTFNQQDAKVFKKEKTEYTELFAEKSNISIKKSC